MLVALVSTVDARDMQGRLLTVAGRTVVGHQIAAALALGCESVLCLVEGREIGADGEDMGRLRRQAAGGGAAFRLVSDIFGISSAVTPPDTLIVFAGGMLPQRSICDLIAAERPGIAAYGSRGGEMNAFERIDADHVWGGIFRAPGDIVERFAAVAPEGDPVSGLLRTALQSGVRLFELADGEVPVVIRTSEQAVAEGERWRRQRLGKPDWRLPGEAIAIHLAFRHARAPGVHDRSSTPATRPFLPLAPFLVVSLAILMAWAGWPVLAFLALGAAFVLRLLSLQHEGEPFGAGTEATTTSTPTSTFSVLSFDLAVLTVSYLTLQAADPGTGIFPDGLAIVMAILALPWLAIRYTIPLWQTAARDRFALCIGLGICALSGSFALAAGILLIVILAAMLTSPKNPTANPSLTKG